MTDQATPAPLTNVDLKRFRARVDTYDGPDHYTYTVDGIPYDGHWAHDIRRLLDEVDRLRADLAESDDLLADADRDRAEARAQLAATAAERNEYARTAAANAAAYDETRAELTAMLKETSNGADDRAAGWDEGYALGVNDERTAESNIGIAGFGAKVNPARENPYRAHEPATATGAPASKGTAPTSRPGGTQGDRHSLSLDQFAGAEHGRAAAYEFANREARAGLRARDTEIERLTTALDRSHAETLRLGISLAETIRERQQARQALGATQRDRAAALDVAADLTTERDQARAEAARAWSEGHAAAMAAMLDEQDSLAAKLFAVRELHTAKRLYVGPDTDDRSFETPEEAAEYDDVPIGSVKDFVICVHCGDIELDDDPDRSYCESLWPCPTIRAFDGITAHTNPAERVETTSRAGAATAPTLIDPTPADILTAAHLIGLIGDKS